MQALAQMAIQFLGHPAVHMQLLCLVCLLWVHYIDAPLELLLPEGTGRESGGRSGSRYWSQPEALVASHPDPGCPTWGLVGSFCHHWGTPTQ
jgi:hypothetical protein